MAHAKSILFKLGIGKQRLRADGGLLLMSDLN